MGFTVPWSVKKPPRGKAQNQTTKKDRNRKTGLESLFKPLRAITDQQREGQVFLAAENLAILEKELAANFRLSVDDLRQAGDDRRTVEVYMMPPPVKVKVKDALAGRVV